MKRKEVIQVFALKKIEYSTRDENGVIGIVLVDYYRKSKVPPPDKLRSAKIALTYINHKLSHIQKVHESPHSSNLKHWKTLISFSCIGQLLGSNETSSVYLQDRKVMATIFSPEIQQILGDSLDVERDGLTQDEYCQNTSFTRLVRDGLQKLKNLYEQKATTEEKFQILPLLEKRFSYFQNQILSLNSKITQTQPVMAE